MRKFSVTLIAAMLLATGSIFANEIKSENDPEKLLSEQISKLLYQNNFTDSENGETAVVLFTLNDKNEIVVLSVSAADKQFEHFIKSRLNYQSVTYGKVKKNKRFVLQVRISS